MKKVNAIQLDAEICKRSFKEFVKGAWPTLEPGKPFVDNFHIDAICNHLEAVYNGDMKRLVINVPPGFMKSLLVSVMFTGWVWTTKPHMKIGVLCYNAALSVDSQEKLMSLIESDWYQIRFGSVFQPNKETWNKTKLINDKMGVRTSGSLYGSLTGRHWDIIVIDDPIKAGDAMGSAGELKTMLEKCSTSFIGTVRSRLTDAKTTSIILVMQRLSEIDLSGVLLESGYDHLCFPVYFVEGRYTSNRLGRYDPRTKDGELLWPERFPEEHLKSEQLAIGPYTFASQYQQQPIPILGSIIKREWIHYWTELPRNQVQMIQSWDTTLSNSSTSDYVVGQVWLKHQSGFYLLDQVRARMDFEQTKNAIKMLSAKWPKAMTKYIENKASGPDVINSLKKEGVIGLIPVKIGSSDKEQRLVAVSGLFAAGNVFLPPADKCSWVLDYVTELCGFPKGSKNDDQVDATSQALIQLHKRSLHTITENLRSMMSWR